MIIRSKKKKKTAKKIVTVSVYTAVIAGVAIIGRLLPRNLADYYSSEIFPFISSLQQRLNSMTRVSLSEITVVVLICVVPPVVVLWLVLLIKKALGRGLGVFLYNSLRNILAVTMVLLIIFEMMHGINYRRTPARTVLGLDRGKITFEDYCAAFEWSYRGMVAARQELKEDDKGVAQMITDFDGLADYASRVMDTFCASYGISRYETYAVPKSVRLSHYWSYTYVIGMYNPFYGETNINTDYMDVTTTPMTLCHELLHAKGFANETDCNLVGTFACITSDRADFRYCGYLNVFVTLLKQIETLMKTKGFEYDFPMTNGDLIPFARDVQAANQYWLSIDKEVLDIQKKLGINITEKSIEANNSFLKSNGENEGVDTYNVPENEYVAFYLMFFANGGQRNA